MLLGWVGILFAGTLFAGEVSQDGYRDFSSADGRNIRGRIVKYDAQRKKLFFERDNKKKMWISPAAFCQEDRDYIKEWIAADQFLSESKLKISIKKKSNSAAVSERRVQGDLNAKIEGIVGIFSELEYVDYELTMDNRTGAVMKGVRVEYRCLVERSGSNGHSDDVAWVSGKLEEGGSAGKGKNSYKTPPICMETTYEVQEERTSSTLNGDPIPTVRVKLWIDDVCGVWFKVYGPSLDGVQVVRDICLPSGLAQRYRWSDTAGGTTNSASEPFCSNSKVSKEPEQEYVEKWRKLKKELRGKNTPVNVRQRKKYILSVKELSIFYDAQYDERGEYSRDIAGFYMICKEYKSALEWYEKSLQEGNLNVHRNLVRLYASGNPETFDGAKAIEYALLVLEDQEKKNPGCLAELASAYARDGQFKMAIKTQKQAIERWRKTRGYGTDETKFKERLELYKNGKPYTM